MVFVRKKLDQNNERWGFTVLLQEHFDITKGF